MSRWSRALTLGLVVLVIASVSVNLSRTFVIADMHGASVPGAYVAYHHEGSTYAVVESVTYSASRLALLQSDASGRVTVPWAVHLHWPLVQTRAQVVVDLVYAPTLHNALAWISRGGAISRPREFEVSTDRANVRLEDVSSDPILWQETLENLSSLISRLKSQPTTGDDTPRLTGELVDHFKGEYSAMLDRYGERPRTAPNMPASVETDQEKRAWQTMVDYDLTQRPRWGDELKRRFATEIAAMAR